MEMKREGFGFGIGEEAEKENLACENHHLMKEKEREDREMVQPLSQRLPQGLPSYPLFLSLDSLYLCSDTVGYTDRNLERESRFQKGRALLFPKIFKTKFNYLYFLRCINYALDLGPKLQMTSNFVYHVFSLGIDNSTPVAISYILI